MNLVSSLALPRSQTAESRPLRTLSSRVLTLQSLSRSPTKWKWVCFQSRLQRHGSGSSCYGNRTNCVWICQPVSVVGCTLDFYKAGDDQCRSHQWSSERAVSSLRLDGWMGAHMYLPDYSGSLVVVCVRLLSCSRGAASAETCAFVNSHWSWTDSNPNSAGSSQRFFLPLPPS